MITEDRHETGMALGMSVVDNLIMRDFRDDPLSARGLLNLDVIHDHALGSSRSTTCVFRVSPCGCGSSRGEPAEGRSRTRAT